MYEILLHLKKYIFQAQDNIRHKFLPLTNVIKQEMPNMDKEALEAAAAVITLLERPSTVQNHPSETASNTFKMMKLGNSTSINVKDSMKAVNIFKNVKIFELNVDGTYPINIKNNYLQTTPSRSSGKTNTLVKRTKGSSFVSIFKPTNKIDDDSATFVYVESKIGINKLKLTEHQKEALNKCREVPSLYQDLSQSQSSNNTKNVSANRTNNDDSVAIISKIEKKETSVKETDIAVPGSAASVVSVDKVDEKNKSLENLKGTVPNTDMKNISVLINKKIIEDTRKKSDKVDVKSYVEDLHNKNNDPRINDLNKTCLNTSTISFDDIPSCENGNLTEKQSREVHKTSPQGKPSEVSERAKRNRKKKSTDCESSTDDGKVVANNKYKRRRLSLLTGANAPVKESTATKSLRLRSGSCDTMHSAQDVPACEMSPKNLLPSSPKNNTSSDAKKTKKHFKIIPSPTFEDSQCPKKITMRISISNEENSVDSSANQVVPKGSILERMLCDQYSKGNYTNLQNQQSKPKECDESGSGNIDTERNEIEEATTSDVLAKSTSLQNKDFVEPHSDQSFDDILQKKLSLVDGVKEPLKNKKIMMALKRIQIDMVNPDEYIKQSTRLRRRNERYCSPEQLPNGKLRPSNSNGQRKSDTPKKNSPHKRANKSKPNEEDNVASNKDVPKIHSMLNVLDTDDTNPGVPLSKHTMKISDSEEKKVQNKGVPIFKSDKKVRPRGRPKKVVRTSISSMSERNAINQMNTEDSFETLQFSTQAPVDSSLKSSSTKTMKDKENSTGRESTASTRKSFLAGERGGKNLNVSSDTDTCDSDEAIYFPQLLINGLVGYGTSKSDLASSPICNNTPVKINEFLTNTIDISPINKEQLRPKQCANTISDKVLSSTKNESNITNEPRTAGKQSNSKESTVKRSSFISTMPKSRSTKLLNLIPNASTTPKGDDSDVYTFSERVAPREASHSKNSSSATTSLHTPSTSRTPITNISVVSTERTQKMMRQYKTNKVGDVRNEIVKESDILEFSREVPSPAALPTGGILKRKSLNSLETENSPHPKVM